MGTLGRGFGTIFFKKNNHENEIEFFALCEIREIDVIYGAILNQIVICARM